MRGTVPPVKSRVPIFVKDLSIVLSSSASLGLACPLATKAVELFKIAEDMGMGNEDDSAVWKVHEGMRRGGKGGEGEEEEEGDEIIFGRGDEKVVEVGEEPR